MKDEGNVIRNWDLCYAVVGSLATLLPTVTWTVENVPNKLSELAKEISRQKVEDPA